MFSYKIMSSEDIKELVLLKLLSINPRAAVYRDQLLDLWERRSIAQALDYVATVAANSVEEVDEPCPDTEPYTSRSPGQIHV